MNTRLCVGLICGLALAAPASAGSRLLELSGTGSLKRSPPAYDDSLLSVGQTLSFRVLIDLDAMDTSSDDESGIYPGAVLSYAVSVGSGRISGAVGNVSVSNRQSDILGWFLNNESTAEVSGDFNGFEFVRVSMGLTDRDGTAIESDSLLDAFTPEGIAAFFEEAESTRFDLFFDIGSGPLSALEATGTIDEITARYIIPAPAAGMWALGAGWFSRRRR